MWNKYEEVSLSLGTCCWILLDKGGFWPRHSSRSTWPLLGPPRDHLPWERCDPSFPLRIKGFSTDSTNVLLNIFRLVNSHLVHKHHANTIIAQHFLLLLLIQRRAKSWRISFSQHYRSKHYIQSCYTLACLLLKGWFSYQTWYEQNFSTFSQMCQNWITLLPVDSI